MAFLAVVSSLFVSWLELFVAPLFDPMVLWILVPIWISWFFTEFFQEKEGTHFGNAVTNGAIPIWVGIDWTRYLTTELSAGAAIEDLAVKFTISGIIVLFGIFVIIQGLKTKGFAHYGGRIRVITYILVMFTPIIYGITRFTWQLFAAIVVFSPIFYFLIELLAKILPDSKALKADITNKPAQDNIPTFSKPAPQATVNDPFSSPPNLPQQNAFGAAPQQPMQQSFSRPQIAPSQNPQFGNLPTFQNTRMPQRRYPY